MWNEMPGGIHTYPHTYRLGRIMRGVRFVRRENARISAQRVWDRRPVGMHNVADSQDLMGGSLDVRGAPCNPRSSD